MKRIQCSPWGKLLASVILLAGVCAGTAFGLRLVQALPFVTVDSFRETVMYERLLEHCQDMVVVCFDYEEELRKNGLSYVERGRLERELRAQADSLEPTQTNFRFRVCTPDGSRVLSENLAGKNLVELVEQVQYSYFLPGEHVVLSQSHQEYAPAVTEKPASEQEKYYVMEYGVHKDTGVSPDLARDEFFDLARCYQREGELFPLWVALTGGCLAAAAAAVLYLMWTAGHRKGYEGIFLSWQEKIWFDLYLFVMFWAAALLCVFLVELLRYSGWGLWTDSLLDSSLREEFILFTAGMCAVVTLLICVAVLTLRTFVVRLKARNLARSTLLCSVLMWCFHSVKRLWVWAKSVLVTLPFVWRSVLLVSGYLLLNCLLFQAARYNGFAAMLWFVLSVSVFCLVCWWSVGFYRVRKGCSAISAGNFSHQIEEKRLPYELKQHAQALNNISGGLQTAVNEQMKSERFKAELITNVSHDLKTPLTSIINYVDLLKTTEQTDPKAEEYIQVLDRKAQRLKKLTEDLVEASKASAGTLAVNREKIGMSQLIDQALGEYAEKLEGRRLQVITSIPEEEAYVYADGRHLWRVVDNLLSNCCKYAMEGTRVYLELKRSRGQVELSVKNISREPLNVPAERLMERFVRGEESRSTEGSGLGLYIARSLTELQGGTFELAVDGDLFKAVVTMPQAG